MALDSSAWPAGAQSSAHISLGAPNALHPLTARLSVRKRLRVMCAGVEVFCIEPERSDEGAVRRHRVLHPTSSRSAHRLVAHLVEMLAGVGERVRLVACTGGLVLPTRARVGPPATSAYRRNAAGERASMVCMCMRVRVALVRDQSRAHCHVHPGSVEKLRYKAVPCARVASSLHVIEVLSALFIVIT